ncbi:ecdysone oxidase-like [Aphomia sociella]
MDAAVAAAQVKATQLILLGVAATFSLTSFLWPKETEVEDGGIFDFIIIGVGTAGSVLLNRLTESGYHTVLGIEAGVDPPIESILPAFFEFLPYSRYDWNYTSEDDGYIAQTHKNKNMQLTSGKMLGGSSSLNHEVYSRGFPRDFDLWSEAIKDNTWNYNNCLPFFKKSEKLEDSAILNSPYKDRHGLDGTIRTQREPNDITKKYLDAFEEIGYSSVLDTSAELGYSQILFTIAHGIRQSTAFSYLFPIKSGRKKMSLLKECLVTKILFDQNNNAIGVNVVNKDGKKLTFRVRIEILLSAGVFNSPQLLMLSGVGPRADLEKLDINVISDLPVGSNLQDHAAVPIIFRTGIHSPLIPKLPNPFKFPLPGILGYAAMNKSQNFPDYLLFGFIFQDSSALLQICTSVFSFENDICNAMYKAAVDRELLFTIPSIVKPKSRGSVKLRSTNPNDAPIININFYSDDEDLENMVTYIEDILRIENSSKFKDINAELVKFDLESCSIHEYRSRDYWRCYIPNMVVSLFHYSSTCPMGTVLDSELKVHGVNRLRVVDASTMPTIISGETGVSVVMIAEKTADLLKKTYLGL